MFLFWEILNGTVGTVDWRINSDPMEASRGCIIMSIVDLIYYPQRNNTI